MKLLYNLTSSPRPIEFCLAVFKLSDTNVITKICNDLVGAKIQISYNIILENKQNFSSSIDNCNIFGDCMENILLPFLKSKIDTIEKGPKQSSPDFWNKNKEYEWALISYTGKYPISIQNKKGTT